MTRTTIDSSCCTTELHRHTESCSITTDTIAAVQWWVRAGYFEVEEEEGGRGGGWEIGRGGIYMRNTGCSLSRSVQTKVSLNFEITCLWTTPYHVWVCIRLLVMHLSRARTLNLWQPGQDRILLSHLPSERPRMTSHYNLGRCANDQLVRLCRSLIMTHSVKHIGWGQSSRSLWHRARRRKGGTRGRRSLRPGTGTGHAPGLFCFS